MILYKKRMAVLITLAVLFVSFDRLLKVLAINNLFNPPIELLGDIFKLNFKANYFIAFSIPFSGWLLNILILVIVVSLLYYFIVFWRREKYDLAGAVSLVIIGAISNLVDRLKFGYVVDYLDLKYFTVFNLADVMIVGGVILLLINFVQKEKAAT